MKYVLTKNNIEYDILTMTLEIPIVGCPYIYNLKLDTQEVISIGDSVTLTIINQEIKGTVVQATTYAGYTILEIIGGTYKMKDELESVGYYGSTLRQIVEFVANQTGQPISINSDQSLLNTVIPRFDKVKTTSADILDKLLGQFGGIWRIELDGTLFIGRETYSDILVSYPSALEGLNYDILNQFSTHYEIYTEEVFFKPGFSINGNSVKEVIITLGSDTLRTQFDFYDPSFRQTQKLTDNQKELLYLRKYRMKVVSQSANGSLTLLPDPDIDLFKNGLRDVPIVYPFPYMSLKVKPGAICFVEFANADPSFPRVTAWEDTDSLLEVTFNRLITAEGAAKKNDRVGYLFFLSGMGGADLQWGQNPTPPPGYSLIPLQITTGSGTVKIG